MKNTFSILHPSSFILSFLVLAEPGGLCVGDARQGIGGGLAGTAFGNNLVVAATGDCPNFRFNENGTVPFYPAAFIADRAVFRRRRGADAGKRVVPNARHGSRNSQRRFYKSPCRGGVRGMVLSLQGDFAYKSGLCLSAMAHSIRQSAVVAAAFGRAGRYGRAVAV